ncbi:MAG: AP protein [Bryobacterales bacterium]|nr:AP protein [Bryobacterales bacterium]
MRLLSFVIFFGGLLTAQTQTKKTILVMTDGLRWQEVFQGVDPALLNKEAGKVKNMEAMRKAYWRETAEQRRAALLPFLWSEMAAKGQIYGNREAGSEASVTNRRNFSYPGYNETLTGFADDRIDSNDKKYNPNVTVLEWLHNKPAYRGKVAAFGAWDAFPWIINGPRAGFPVNAGYDAMEMTPTTAAMELLNRLKAESPRDPEGEPIDALTFHTAFEYLKTRKPSVLFLSLGETDEWAHAGKYEEYIRAANRVDLYLKTLWEQAQSMPEYRGVTSLVVTVDHGRGRAPVDWKSHGEKLDETKYIWMAFMGPDTKALGERKNVGPVTQSQVAATVAALLGEDYAGAVSKAGKPIADVVGK